MTNEQDQTRSQLALVAALAKNRGELDAATLERLLRLVGALKPVDKPVG
jgi:arginine repressor